MNSNSSRFLSGAALAALLSLTANAAPPASGSELILPQPVTEAVVAPKHVPYRYLNATVKVALTIDEQGVPSDIRVNGGRDRALTESLVPAIAQWRFTPAMKNGVPVKRQAILPLTLVEET